MSSQPVIRLGTRASQLAMWQSNWVKSQLEGLGVSVKLIPIRTEGDTNRASLKQIGGQGVFTKRLQDALLENEIDLAVHSLKDLPTQDHPGLKIAAIPERESTADALISPEYSDLASLPDQATVGTGSVRRAAQLLHVRPDLNMVDIRGNVDTRLKKLKNDNLDAIVLACAGLYRLSLQDVISQEFTPDIVMPAVGQGALGLEIRSDDEHSLQWVEHLNHPDSFQRAISERSMLARLFAGCLAPVGCCTQFENGQLIIEGVVLSPDGKTRIYAKAAKDPQHYRELGIEVAEKLLANGAEPILQRL
ncbi:MAG: hydroxymethylbilane synthase [Planctomycetota bacterium]